jgi:ubiquinone/menaquinone biosynthesis C-methylase UbiE
MQTDDLIDEMRRDWDARAADDARFFVNCQGRNQDDAAFFNSAPDILARVRRDYPYLRSAGVGERRFLEIGCGLGRLVYSLAEDCGEIHGVDISPAMVSGARQALSDVPHAHFHVTENSDLAMFADSLFDLAYSFAVFQHIPDQALVYKYVDEAFRVLKPGGILIAQFNGAARPSDSYDSWAGVWFTEEELLQYVNRTGWMVLSDEGQLTQYLWLTLRKPLPGEPNNTDLPAPGSIKIDGVSHPWGGHDLAAGGVAGFAEIHTRGLTDRYADLFNLTAMIDQRPIPVRFIAALQPDGARQINVEIPEGILPGRRSIVLCWKGRQITNSLDVTVLSEPPPMPRS